MNFPLRVIHKHKIGLSRKLWVNKEPTYTLFLPLSQSLMENRIFLCKLVNAVSRIWQHRSLLLHTSIIPTRASPAQHCENLMNPSFVVIKDQILWLKLFMPGVLNFGVGSTVEWCLVQHRTKLCFGRNLSTFTSIKTSLNPMWELPLNTQSFEPVSLLCTNLWSHSNSDQFEFELN